MGSIVYNVSKTCLSRMEMLQEKLLKAGIGVHKWSRSSPILKALTTIDISSLDLGRSILCNGSRVRSFYIYLMNMHACGQLNGHNYLVSRIRKTCDKHNVSFLKYVLMTITPAMYGKTYCACLTMAWATTLWSIWSCTSKHFAESILVVSCPMYIFHHCTLRSEGYT